MLRTITAFAVILTAGAWSGGPAGSLRPTPSVMAFPLLAGASPGSAESRQQPNELLDSARRERLAIWMRAIEGHRLGTFDRPAASVATWSAADLRGLAEDLGTQARTRNLNSVLQRSAILCLDLAMQAPSGTLARGDARSVNAFDGQSVSFTNSPAVYDVGRLLLNSVAPSPRENETVRLWYLATAAFLESTGDLTEAKRHLGFALRVLRENSDILFLTGWLHEMFASPRVQTSARSLKRPPSVGDWWTDKTQGLSAMDLDIRSPEEHLRQAETFLRRAAELDPGATRTRMHLGRVRGRMGDHKRAVADLQAAEKATDQETLYLAHLFRGAEEEALGNREAAREAYQHAVEVLPKAQAPYVALSRLAAGAGARGEAQEALEQVWRLPQADLQREDPWWQYDFVNRALVDDLYRRLTAPITRKEGQ